jgi:hypothetical protein
MHSLVVAYLVPETIAIHALLHDAAEIYIGDIPSPIKSFLISEFEESGLKSIYAQLCLPFPSSEAKNIVKVADVRSCIAEVWTVGPESPRVLPEFQKRDRFAESMITQMLDIYDYSSVLDADGKYVNLFVDLFHRLKP